MGEGGRLAAKVVEEARGERLVLRVQQRRCRLGQRQSRNVSIAADLCGKGGGEDVCVCVCVCVGGGVP